jgi:hypothetical protein
MSTASSRRLPPPFNVAAAAGLGGAAPSQHQKVPRDLIMVSRKTTLGHAKNMYPYHHIIWLASLMDDPEEQDPFNNEANSMWGEHPPPQDDGMLPHHNAEQADLMEAPPFGTQHSCCLLSYS